MLSPTHIATRSGGRPSVPAWTAAKRGFLSLGPVWHRTAAATMPAEARFARVAGQPGLGAVGHDHDAPAELAHEGR